MQNAGFKYLNLNSTYDKTVVKDENIKELFFSLGLSGANITVPHKETAYKLADKIVGTARTIKAVNTYIEQNGKIIAHNTDGSGFMSAIEEFGDISSVLIIGAGGTAKAIAVSLIEANINTTVVNRTATKLDFFQTIGATVAPMSDFEPNIAYDLVVNATSAGLDNLHYPMPLDKLEQIIKNCLFVFDCIYATDTAFLVLAKQLNKRYKGGEDMLLYQGVKALELWTNTKATKALVDTMREALHQTTTK
jgi:shikimate dehydrogenase